MYMSAAIFESDLFVRPDTPRSLVKTGGDYEHGPAGSRPELWHEGIGNMVQGFGGDAAQI